MKGNGVERAFLWALPELSKTESHTEQGEQFLGKILMVIY